MFGNNNRNKGIAEVEILDFDLIFSTAALMIDGDGTLNHFKYHERIIISFCNFELYSSGHASEVK